ncbi:MAG: hypothetical protein U9Q58_09855, partial [Pseudomonadota bacterium]|nr:hypothetical protein [Pseudomonadota bacterium]
ASVWPEPANSEKALKRGPSLADQETICDILEETSGSFQRLKLLMDTWCAFWFWPLDKADDLPKRKSFLAAAGLLLGNKTPDRAAWPLLSVHLGFEVEILVKAAAEKVPDTENLAAAVSWFGISHELAEEQNFHHWELVFPEILGVETENRGFSLVLGNPPWVKASWNDAVVLAEFDVTLGVKEAKSAQYNRARLPLLEDLQNRAFYTDEFRRGEGGVTFLNSHHEYPLLAGIQTNLYKNFIVKSWAILADTGIGGLLHPEGVFDDAQGGRFRSVYYKKLVYHYQFQNFLPLFHDVKTNRTFSVNIFRCHALAKISMTCIFNLYHPSTIERSRMHDKIEEKVPGLKTNEGKLNLKGHQNRIIKISNKELSVFSKLFGYSNITEEYARLLQVQSENLVSVLIRFSKVSRRLIDITGEYKPSEMLHETTSQQKGLISLHKEPPFEPQKPSEWVAILSHINVGTAFRKRPTSGNNYEEIELFEIEDNYLPPSIYKPGDKDCSLNKFDQKNQSIQLASTGKPTIDKYRYVNRQLAKCADSRTLISSIIPPGTVHVHSLLSIAFDDNRIMVIFTGSSHSICFD